MTDEPGLTRTHAGVTVNDENIAFRNARQAAEQNKNNATAPTDTTNNGTSPTTYTTPATPATSLSQYKAAGTNRLHKYQTYNALFTLAALSRQQMKSAKFSSGSIDKVICSSKGDWKDPKKRATTSFGSYDYWIDDLIIVTQPSFSPATGNMFGHRISFTVTEPYSMGLFMLTCKEAATQAGYLQNFASAPFLLIIEFAGYVNDKPEIDGKLTRYIPMMFTKVEFKVTAAGTVYTCEGVPYQETALRDFEAKTLTDTLLRGDNVQDLLKGGNSNGGLNSEKSLEAAIRKQHLDAIKDKSLKAVDDFQIIFPKNWQSKSDDGNEISKSKLFNDYNDAGTVPFPDYVKVFDPNKKIIQNAKLKITTEKNLQFPQGIKIQDIIQEVIIRSEYISNQVVGGKIKHDGRGFVNWFRIEIDVEDLADNAQYNRQNRKYIYRVVPYKVHQSTFLPPNRQSEGLDNLRNSVSRIYRYIYTGQNQDVITANLDFGMNTWVLPFPSDLGTRTGQNNENQGGAQAGGPDQNKAPAPTSTPVQQTASAGPNTRRELSPVQPPTGVTPIRAHGGAGNDSEKTAQARFLVDRVANQASLIELEITIHGDPYYICSSGMGWQVVPPINENELADGSMNYQDSEVDVIFEFRTPVDLNPETGLYRFEKTIDLYSGLYRVKEIHSKFMKNNFTQVVFLHKRRGEFGGVPPTAAIAEPVGASVYSPGQALAAGIAPV